jgi:thiamine transport system permease protein
MKIDLPLLRPALTKAAGLCAAVSLGEFGATSFLSRSNSTTIPIAIGQLLGHPGTVMSHSAYALATLTIVAVSILI